jgi:multidrug efflux system outer membrane protein
MVNKMKPTLAINTALIAVVSLLGACSLMPDYERPPAPVPASWPTGPSYQAEKSGADATAVADIAWRDFFADARLRQVIELALINNRDLRISTLNIEKARAQYGIARAALLPTVAATANQTAVKVPGGLNSTGKAKISREYDANLGITAYELDFFGRVSSLSEAALQSYLATEDARRAQQISLVAEVANNYLNLAADQQRLRLASETLASQQVSYDLSFRRFNAGTTSGLSVYEAKASVEAARSEVGRFTSLVAIDQNALTLVVGSQVAAELLPSDAIGSVTLLADIPAGLPSDLLQRRPDVLQAERGLQGANANIGAARAAFFPKITLTGATGVASGNLSGLFDSGTSAWSFIPKISLPIFDGGVNFANLTISKVNRDIAVATYEKSIQSAFREVADALAQRGTLDERLASQQALVDASSKSYRIYEARYRLGADSYLNALISLRALYTAQQNLITLQLSNSANRVTLYKVLGGGWRQQDEPLAAADQGRW